MTKEEREIITKARDCAQNMFATSASFERLEKVVKLLNSLIEPKEDKLPKYKVYEKFGYEKTDGKTKLYSIIVGAHSPKEADALLEECGLAPLEYHYRTPTKSKILIDFANGRLCVGKAFEDEICKHRINKNNPINWVTLLEK